MYSLGRHLANLHSGRSYLRQICVDNAIKSISTTTIAGVKCQLPIDGRRFLSCIRGSSSSQGGPFRRLLSKQSEIIGSTKFVDRHCRCYSQSAEKPVAKEEESNASGEAEQTPTESSVDEEELDRYDDEDEEGLSLTDEEVQELTDGDAELIKKIKYIQLEHSVMRQDGESVPSFIKLKHWKEILLLNSRSKRKKYYLYLFKTEMKERSQVRKKEEKREERLKSYAENPLPSREEDIYGTFYALSRNCLFLRLYDATITKHFNNIVARAMLLHPPLIIDCSYDEHMTFRESKNCAKQIELLISENRTHAEPYNLYLCNAGRETKTVEYLKRLIPIIEDDNFPINLHEESYMDLFPRDRLVYLTPHTRDELEEYNEDDIYIIGAMVDKTDSRPYSLAKAKKLGLRMRRLPLDKHLMWGLGGKSLTLNQMVKIMLDVRYTRGDWKTALKHVPMRKLCRDFHPYPDQVQDQNGESEPENSSMTPHRKEKKSFVMEDFELLHRRKGFRRSDTFSSNRRSSQAVQAPRIKSLLQDDD